MASPTHHTTSPNNLKIKEEMSPERGRLLQLPTELKVAIVSYLATTDQSSVRTLLLTCKILYDIALPFSVRIFRNTPHRDDGGFCSERRNAQFLRYILLSRPQVATLVETMILGSFSSHPKIGYDNPIVDEDNQNEEDEQFEEYAPGELALYKQRIIDFCDSDSEQNPRHGWIRDLEKGSSDAQLALIVISCPNLQRIYFETPYDQHYFLHVLQLSGNPNAKIRRGLQPPLSRLRIIYTESQEISRNMNTIYRYNDVDPDRNPGYFFKLKAARSFESVNACYGDEIGDWFDKLPTRSSRVEDIFLRRSYISPRMLQGMLAACKAVKKLEITRGLYINHLAELLPRDVLTAILPHSDSLEYCHLNIEENWGSPISPNEQSRQERLYMGHGLRDMKALKALIIDMCSLTGPLERHTISSDDHISRVSIVPLKMDGVPTLVDCLPENLEYLEIHYCSEAILNQAQQLIVAIQTRQALIKLKEIRLLFSCEKDDPEKFQLSYDPSIINLELIFQSYENRIYDLIPAYNGGNGRVEAICSPIYAEHLREQWLAIRGRDIGFASTDFELYEAPETKVSPN